MKQLITLLFVVPFMLKGQFEKPTDEIQYQHVCSYDAECTAKHIMMKHVKSYLYDTVAFTMKNQSLKLMNPTQVEKKILKTLKKGKSAYSSKTNSGYSFTIVVVDVKDDTKILNFISFEVDHFYQKIISVEISKGI